MSDEGAKHPGYPRIDLETVRDTLAYIRDDMAALPELSKVAQSLTKALDEIAQLNRAAAGAHQEQQPGARVIPFSRLNFVPWMARN